MNKKILLIALIASVLGLLSELVALTDALPRESILPILYIKGWLSCLNLSFFNFGIFQYHNFESGLYLNYINLLFFVLLFIGALSYTFSQYRETRLLRFVFSVVLLVNITFFVFSFIYLFIYWQQFQAQKYWWIYWILARLVNTLWIYLSYIVLNNIGKTKKPDVSIPEMGIKADPSFNIASNWQRLFHLIVDLYLCIFIFSAAIPALIPKFAELLENHIGERGALYAFVFIFRLIYYPFFEILLGATPAKFLTETFVTDTNGNRVGADKIMLRTFARFIPFESFSFLGGNGWHDSLTGTQVVREVRTGIKGRWYFLIIPASLIIGLGYYLGHEKYKDYQYRQYSIKQHNEKIRSLEHSLNHLSTSDVIEIEDVVHPYSSNAIFLKVEETGKDELIVSLLQKENDYTKSLYLLEKIYNKNKNYLSQIPVKMSDLRKAYTPDYDQSSTDERNSAELLMDGRKFEIKSIDKLFRPVIKDRGTGSYGNSISLDLLNIGWPADIIEITNLEGEIKWENELPQRIESVRSGDYPSFSLDGSNYKRSSKYKIKMVLADSLNRHHSYIIEGADLKKTIIQE